jgi:DNA mismatch repair protein MutS
MQTDTSTLQDLSVIHPDDAQSILKRLDFCRSEGGRKKLKYLITHPHKTLEQIKETEDIIKLIRAQLHNWPEEITNGTIQMIDQFYAYPLGFVPKRSVISASLYQLFNRNEYAMMRFSVHHFIDFLKGIEKIHHLLNQSNDVNSLNDLKEEINHLLSPEAIKNVLTVINKQQVSSIHLLRYGSYLYHKFRNSFQRLKEIYFRLDAWQSMTFAS